MKNFNIAVRNRGRKLDGLIWGSCQYTPAAAAYYVLCDEEKAYGRDKALSNFGLEMCKCLPCTEDITRVLQAKLLEHTLLDIRDEEENTQRQLITELHTVTEFLHFMRNESWDLWSAIAFLEKALLQGLPLEENETGIGCFLLKSYGLVTDEEAFKDWDT